MYKIVLSFLFVAVASMAWSQKTIITGADSVHAGFQVAAYATTDYISGKRELLASGRISDGGFFHLEMEVREPREIKLVVLNLEGTIYAEPAKTYQVAFPPVGTVDFQRFDRSEVELEFEGLPANDLNILIRDFNSEYNAFFNEHYYDFAVDEFKGTPEFTKRMSEKSKENIYGRSATSDSLKLTSVSNFDNVVSTFINEVQLKYSPHYSNTFFRDYVRYSLAGVELTAGLPKKQFYREYFMSQKMLLLNPAYMRVFHIFYHDLFSQQPDHIQSAIIKTINVQHDAKKLTSLFDTDSLLLGEDIRIAAVLKGLKDVYNNKAYDKGSVEKTLRKMADVSSADLKIVSMNTVEQLKRNKQDWLQEDFTLLDAKEEKWSLYDSQGLPVYLFFFASWSPASVKEVLLLEKLYDTYSKDVRMVVICMDPKYETFKKYLAEHRKQEFVFLYGYGDILLREKCGLKSVPHAIMLDKDLHVMMDFAPMPSQGIQATFAKLKQQAQSGGQKPGTWNKQ